MAQDQHVQTASPRVRLAVAGLQHGHILSVMRYVSTHPGFELVAIAERDTDLARRTGEQWQLPVYAHIDDLLANEEVDAVALAPVNSEKGPLIAHCLRQGLHVLVDKPLVTTEEQLADVREALETSGRILSLMLTLRFTPSYATACRLVREGAIGRLVHAWLCRPHKLNLPRRPPWMFRRETYGGIIADLLIHDIDIFRWVTGATDADIKELFALHGNHSVPQHPEFEDVGHVLLRLQDGTVGSFEASWLTPDGASYHGDCRAIFTGDRGVIEVDTVRDRVLLTTNTEPTAEVPLDTTCRVEDDFLIGIREGRSQMILPPEEAVESTTWTLRARAAADRYGK